MKNSLSWLPLASGFLVLVLSLGLAVVTVSNRSAVAPGSGQSTTAKATEAIPTLSLSPEQGQYNYSPGGSYPIGIILDSAGKSVDGVDVVISFDPTKVEIVSGKVNPTTVFTEFPLNKVDTVLGKLRFSGLTFSPGPVTGVVGTFSIKPLVRGEVNLTFDFVAGATTDSNIAMHGSATDILGKVVNGRYFFK